MTVNSVVDGSPHRNDGSDQTAPHLPLLASTNRAAAELGLHPAMVRREIKAGRLSAVRYGRKLLVPRESLKAFAAGLPDAGPLEQKR